MNRKNRRAGVHVADKTVVQAEDLPPSYTGVAHLTEEERGEIGAQGDDPDTIAALMCFADVRPEGLAQGAHNDGMVVMSARFGIPYGVIKDFDAGSSQLVTADGVPTALLRLRALFGVHAPRIVRILVPRDALAEDVINVLETREGKTLERAEYLAIRFGEYMESLAADGLAEDDHAATRAAFRALIDGGEIS